MRILIAILGMLAVAGPLQSQDVNGDGFVSFLVPIAFPSGRVVPGAFGTRWASELWLHNASTGNFTSLQPASLCLPSCEITVPSGYRGRLLWVNSNQNSAMLHVPAEHADRMFLSARLLELSRQSQPTGVEVPIIEESDFFVGERWILGVPIGEGTRAALRVYDPYARADTAVQVDFFAAGTSSGVPGATLGSAVFRPGGDPLAGYTGLYPTEVPTVAATFHLVVDFPMLAGIEFVDIRLTPLVAGRPYWAFANVTHNDTQHVLLVTSQP